MTEIKTIKRPLYRRNAWFWDVFDLANNANLDTICTPEQFGNLEIKCFTAYCTRLLFPPDLTACSVEPGLFVFITLLLSPLNDIRVKDEVIVCKMFIRVRVTYK